MSAAAPAGALALVTGATGFLGLHLAEALRAAGWRINALHRAGSQTGALRDLGVGLIRGDVLDPASLRAAITPETDAVIHAAADLSVWRPKDAQQTVVNVAGTANVVAATLAARRPRLVHVSTIAAYGEQVEPIGELTVSNAASSWINYERSKWLAEEEVRKGMQRGLAAVIVVPSAVVGPRDRTGWAKMFIEIAHRRVPFCPRGSATFNDVRAVASALVASATQGRAGERYLLAGEDMSFAAFMGLAAEEIGVPLPKLTLPRGLMRALVALGDWQSTRRGVEPAMTREMAALLCRDTLCGSRKAEAEIAYRPAPIRAAVRDSVRSLREAGLL